MSSTSKPPRAVHPLADSPHYKWLATAAVILGMMGSVLASTMVNIAIPDVMGAYGIGQDQAHWLSTAFLSAMPVMMLTNAWFVNNLGARTTFVAACVLFAVASLVGQFMPNYWGLVAVRTVQGACAGLLQPLTMSVILPLFPPEERGRAMGIYFMGFILGPAMGPTVGGIIVDNWHWRDVFGASIPIMVVAAIMGVRYVPHRDPNVSKPKMNWLSLICIALAMATFLTGISNGQRDGWDSPAVFGLLFTAACALLAFVTVELVTRAPLLEMRLFSVRSFSLSTVVGFMLGAGMFGSLYVLPIYAQTVLQYTALKAGLLLLFTGMVQFPIFPLGGRLAQSRHSGVSISVGMLLFGVSSVALAYTDINSAFWAVAVWAAIGRAGLGVAMPSLQTGALRDLPSELLAYGAGTLSFIRMTGAAIGTNVLAITLQSRTARHADYLAATQTPDNPATGDLLERVSGLLVDQGIGAADQLPLALQFLARMVLNQANAMAFHDGFMLLAVGFFLAALSALALVPGRAPKRPSTAHAPARPLASRGSG